MGLLELTLQRERKLSVTMVSYSAFSVIVLGVVATLTSAQPYAPQRPVPTPYQPSAGAQKVYSGSYVPPATPYSQSYAGGDSYEYQNGGYDYFIDTFWYK